MSNLATDNSLSRHLRSAISLKLIALMAICVLVSSFGSEIYAQTIDPNAEGPTWRILRLDKNGRPVIVDKGTGKELRPDGGGSGDLPQARTPSDSQLNEIDTSTILRGQILIVNPPSEMRSDLRGNGYTILEDLTLGNLGFNVLRVAIPPSLSEVNAIRNLKQAYPTVLMDTNQTYDPSAKKADAIDFSRRYVGWGVVPLTCGAGLRIGMIDGAVDKRIPALRDRDVTFKAFTAKGRKPAGQKHGTAVASILVGASDFGSAPVGLLPGAQLFAAGIFEDRNGRTVSNLGNILKAADWLVGRKVQVVNMSVAGSQNGVLVMVLNKFVESGVALVAAAGNFGPSAKPAWPAAHSNVIAVTAVDKKLRIYSHANQGNYIDFAAPGVNLTTLVPGGRRPQSGTSFAAPFLTAMIAVHLKSGFPVDASQLRSSLKRYTKDLGKKGKDSTFGWGLVRLKPTC